MCTKDGGWAPYDGNDMADVHAINDIIIKTAIKRFKSNEGLAIDNFCGNAM